MKGEKRSRRGSIYGTDYIKLVEFYNKWKDFDLKEGDIIIAPYPMIDNEFVYTTVELEMKVTKIYPYIFIAEALELSPGGRVLSKAYRKIDYSIGFIKRNK